MAEIKDIAVFGAGGFGREVACLIKRINKVKPIWNFIGFFDDNEALKGTRNEYGEVLGTVDDLNKWDKPLSIAIGIGSPTAVHSVIGEITNPRVDFPNLIDPTAVIVDEDNYKIGMGNILIGGCSISIAVKIGDFNVFSSSTGIGHDSIIGDYNSFMPNVNISGGVIIGNKNFFGVKSTVLQYLKIGNRVTIGANTLIIRNPKDNALYIGVPAKKIDL